MAQKEGRPDWRRVGRDFLIARRKPMTYLWELVAPYLRALIADMGVLKTVRDLEI